MFRLSRADMLSTPGANAGGRQTSALVLIVLGATVVHLLVLQLVGDSWPREYVRLWFEGRTAVLTSANSEVDNLLSPLAVDGNVLLTVERCRDATPLQKQILSRYYYRSSYAIYPR